MQGQVTSGANCIAQRAVITALQENPSKINHWKSDDRDFPNDLVPFNDVHAGI